MYNCTRLVRFAIPIREAYMWNGSNYTFSMFSWIEQQLLFMLFNIRKERLEFQTHNNWRNIVMLQIADDATQWLSFRKPKRKLIAWHWKELSILREKEMFCD